MLHLALVKYICKLRYLTVDLVGQDLKNTEDLFRKDFSKLIYYGIHLFLKFKISLYCLLQKMFNFNEKVETKANHDDIHAYITTQILNPSADGVHSKS